MYKDGIKGGLWVLGGTSSTSHLVDPLANVVMFPFGFSPDGRWFAYAISSEEKGYENATMILRSFTGEVITKTIDIRDSYSRLSAVKDLRLGGGNWINGNLIETNLYFKYGLAEMSSYRKSAVLDPFQGTWQNSILEQLPNLSHEYPKNVTGISPDETRVMYYADIKSEQSSAMTLWDTMNKQQLFQDLEFGPVWDADIEWSPDSSQVIYYAVGELDKQGVFLLSRNGETREDILSTNGNQPMGMILSQAIWSPDGRYIAILHLDNEWRGKVRTISVYELASKRFIYSCSFETPPPNGVVRIIWSPNNRNFFSYSFDPKSPIYLLDLTTGTVMELPIRGSVVGLSDSSWQIQP